jgi:peptide/nickel transport system ATP-binding protein
MSPNAIEAVGLIRIHGTPPTAVPALRGLDLTVAPGELVGIVGASGSGKSTLLRILGGLDLPSAGRVRSFGLDLDQAPARALARYRRDVVGTIEQHYWRSLSPYLTARRAIELPLILRGWRRLEREERSAELLERIGLADRGDAVPAELSGGEQQRVAFAAALAARPRLLLADEPTGELDERTAGELLRLLGELIRADGATAVVVTHDRLVEDLADRVVHLRDGRAIAVRAGGPTSLVTGTVDAIGWTAPPLPGPPPPIPPVGPSSSAMPAVVLDDIVRTYGAGRSAVNAIHGLSASFAHGGLHVITGPSGSGKSTLLRLIVGLDRPTSGVVRTLGTDLGTLDSNELAAFRAGRIAICSQAPRLISFLSVLENIELALSIRQPSMPEAERRERAAAALGQVAMDRYRDAAPDGLSGGERARVGIARALAAEPELIVLDEPTAALDRATAATIITLLGRLDRAGRTLLVATHDRDFIAAASDRLDLRDLGTATASSRLGSSSP